MTEPVPSSPPQSIDKPEVVNTAVGMLYLHLVIHAVHTLLLGPVPAQPTSKFTFPFALLLVCGLEVWLLVKIAQGRNWARITYVVLFVLGAPFALLGLVTRFLHSPADAALSLAVLALQIVAVVMLCGRAASRWFLPAPASSPSITPTDITRSA